MLFAGESKVKDMMEQLNNIGLYNIDSDIVNNLNDFYGGFATEEDTLNAIKNIWKENKYLIDTHTAVGYSVYKKYSFGSF